MLGADAGVEAGALAVLSVAVEGSFFSAGAALFPDSDAPLEPVSDPASDAGAELLAA